MNSPQELFGGLTDLASPLLPLRSTSPSYLRFLEEANESVEMHRQHVIKMILDSELPEGMWHPNGFATFNVVQLGIGLIRLHVWPRGMRKSVPGHPEIHNHSFQLFSRIIAGVYRESLYDLAPESGTQLHVYRVLPNREQGKDTLTDAHETLGIARTHAGLVFPAGTWHEVEVGQFHSTPIPKHHFCATLALLSPRIPGAWDTLLGKSGFELMSHIRPRVEPKEWAEIRKQLIDELPSSD